MHADLDTLLTTVYCMADDLLPCKPNNARRRVTDAEVVTLCVAQAIMGEPEDPRFLARAPKGSFATSSRAAANSPATGSAASAWRRRSSAWSGSSQPSARASR